MRVAVENTARVGRTQVGYDVAWLEPVQDVSGKCFATLAVSEAIADMDHERKVLFPRDVFRQPDELLAVFQHERSGHAQLDAADQSGVRVNAARDQRPIDLVEAEHVGRPRRGQREAANVHITDDSGSGAGSDVRIESADVRDADRAGIDDGRHARAYADLIGLTAVQSNPGRGRAVGDVGMQVDQAGHDAAIGATHLQDALGLAGRYVRFDGGDPTRRDGDVELPVEALARVQHMAALDQQIADRMMLLHACAVSCRTPDADDL